MDSAHVKRTSRAARLISAHVSGCSRMSFKTSAHNSTKLFALLVSESPPKIQAVHHFLVCRSARLLRGQPATAEGRLRSWYYVLELSGDFIVEQAIHALDVATWIINADPVRAVGMGGHQHRL